jgi:uncharacterized membrane protein YeiH
LRKLLTKGPLVTTFLSSVYDSLDVISVFIFAVLGGLLAVRRQLPLTLVTLSALLTGLGGGLVRDLIIEAPPVAFHRPDYLGAVVVAAALVAVGHSYLNRYKGVLEIVETLGLALFCVAGTAKVISYGYGPALAVALGVFSAVGGGMLRDALAGRFPDFLRRDRMLFAAPLVVLAGTTSMLLLLHAFDEVSRVVLLLAAVAALLLAIQHYRKKIAAKTALGRPHEWALINSRQA